jgi:hypothetical protein
MTAPYPGWRSRVCSCCSRRGTKGEGRPPPVAGPIMCAPQARPALFQARGRPFMPGPGKAARVLTAPPGHRSRLAGNANRCNRWRDGKSIGQGLGAGKKCAAVRCFCWGNGRGLPRSAVILGCLHVRPDASRRERQRPSKGEGGWRGRSPPSVGYADISPSRGEIGRWRHCRPEGRWWGGRGWLDAGGF